MKAIFTTLLALAQATLLVSAASIHGINRRQHHDIQTRSNSTLSKRVSGSKWSYYDTQTGNAGSCGRHLLNSEFVVAVSAADMHPGLCGQQITLSYEGRTAVATIQDTCPVCPPGGLDLSIGLFHYIAPNGDGIVYGSWEFGSAPVYTPPPPEPTTTWQPEPTTTWTPEPTPTTTSTSIVESPATTTTSSAAATSSAPSLVDNARTSVPQEGLGGLQYVFLGLGGVTIDGASL